MAFVLETDSISSQNITSRVKVGSYTVAADGYITIKIALNSMNTASQATITADVEITQSATVYKGPYLSEPKKSASDPTFKRDLFVLFVESGDVVDLYIESSNSSDTSVSGYVKFVDGARSSNAPTVAAIAAQITSDHGAGSYADTGPADVSALALETTAQSIKTTAEALPSASTIASAVWAAVTSGLSTAGTIGKLLVDNINATISSRSTLTTQQVRDAMKLAPTAGDPASGSVDGDMDTLLSRTASGVTVAVRNSVSANGELLTLVQGEAYLNAIGNALTFGVTDSRLSSAITSDGTTVTLRVAKRKGTRDVVLAITGTIVSFTDGVATFRFDVTSAQTASLTKGDRVNMYEIDLAMAGNSSQILTPIAEAPCTVLEHIA